MKLLKGTARVGNLHPMQRSVATMTTPRLAQPAAPDVEVIHHSDDDDDDDDYGGGRRSRRFDSDSGGDPAPTDSDAESSSRLASRRRGRAVSPGAGAPAGSSESPVPGRSGTGKRQDDSAVRNERDVNSRGRVAERLTADDGDSEADADGVEERKGGDSSTNGSVRNSGAGGNGNGNGNGSVDGSVDAGSYQYYDPSAGVFSGWAYDTASGEYYWVQDDGSGGGGGGNEGDTPADAAENLEM